VPSENAPRKHCEFNTLHMNGDDHFAEVAADSRKTSKGELEKFRKREVQYEGYQKFIEGQRD